MDLTFNRIFVVGFPKCGTSSLQASFSRLGIPSVHWSDTVPPLPKDTDWQEKVNIINLGFDGTCTVRDSINWITEELAINPNIFYGDEIRGWVGDSPLIHLATDKIKTANWTPQWTIESSVKDTVRYLKTNGWLF